MSRVRTKNSSYRIDYTALSTEDLLALYHQNLASRNSRRNEEALHLTFDWDSERDTDEASELEYDAAVDAADEAARAEARARRQELNDGAWTVTSEQENDRLAREPAADDIDKDWVMIDVAEREGSLDKLQENRMVPVQTASHDTVGDTKNEVDPSKPKEKPAKPSKKKAARTTKNTTKRPPFALYGWRSDSNVQLWQNKSTYNVKAAAEVKPSSLRAGVLAGLLPPEADDTEVHNHAHSHAHPSKENLSSQRGFVPPARRSRQKQGHKPKSVSKTDKAPVAKTDKAPQPQIRREHRLDIPRLGLTAAHKRDQETSSSTTSNKVASREMKKAQNKSTAVPPKPSATDRLHALLQAESRNRKGEWRTEYSDYIDSAAAAAAQSRRHKPARSVYGAHTPAGGMRHDPGRFFDLPQTVDPHPRGYHNEAPEYGVHHVQPWRGTSPGKWRPSEHAGIGRADGMARADDVTFPRRQMQPRVDETSPKRAASMLPLHASAAAPSFSAVARPDGASVGHASTFFEHLDAVEAGNAKPDQPGVSRRFQKAAGGDDVDRLSTTTTTLPDRAPPDHRRAVETHLQPAAVSANGASVGHASTFFEHLDAVDAGHAAPDQPRASRRPQKAWNGEGANHVPHAATATVLDQAPPGNRHVIGRHPQSVTDSVVADDAATYTPP